MHANDDVHILTGNAVDKGERDKVIQPPTSSVTTLISVPSTQPLPSDPAPDPQLANSIPFLSEPPAHPQPETLKESLPEPLQEEDPPQELGRGQHIQKKSPGAYKRMAEGLLPLNVNIAEFDTKIVEDEDDWEAELPLDFALIGIQVA